MIGKKEQTPSEEKVVKTKKVRKRVNAATVKTIIGLLLIVLAIGGFYLWETMGEEMATYKTIYVFNQDVKAGTVVEKSLLGTKKVAEDSVLEEGEITDYNTILGKTTTGFVPKGMQLVEGFFTDTNTFVSANEKTMKIPTEWLYDYPDTIRRGDTIYLYEINEYAMATRGSGIETQINTKPVISSGSRIAYVKDSSNREVLDSSSEERYDGSSNIDSIEIIVTEEEYKKILQSVYDGNSFIIMY